jgi:hypothetical protein
LEISVSPIEGLHCLSPTHTVEGILLYSRSTDLKVSQA